MTALIRANFFMTGMGIGCLVPTHENSIDAVCLFDGDVTSALRRG
jgi:hypothetical protein